MPVSFRVVSMSGHRLQAGDPRDPQPELNAMVHLDVYTLQLPVGAVSRNIEFWKSVDEQAVGVAMEDRLVKSGIRTGMAPKSEGEFFSRFFDRHVIRKRLTVANAMHADTVQIELGKLVDTEDVFFFDSKGQNTGKTYDQCTNGIAVGFGPAPHEPGGIRLSVCPTIKCEHQRPLYTSLTQEFDAPASDETDRLYDIAFSAELPGDNFFIIAPSGDASRPTSLGGRLLMQDDKSERLEQVIVIVPTFLPLDGKPVAVQSVVK